MYYVLQSSMIVRLCAAEARDQHTATRLLSLARVERDRHGIYTTSPFAIQREHPPSTLRSFPFVSSLARINQLFFLLRPTISGQLFRWC